MAQFAPVAPINILERMQAHGRFGQYHLFLAHHTVAESKRFQALMAQERNARAQTNRSSGGYTPSPTIIMDNSIIELGTALDANLVVDAADIVGAKYIVLPDVFHEAVMTIQAIEEGYEQILKSGRKVDAKFMIVPQGRTLEGYLAVVEHFSGQNWVGMIGLPRNAVKMFRSRRDLVQLTAAICPRTPIHLLGFSEDVCDDILSARSHENVKGIDSAVPVRFASEEKQPFNVGYAGYAKPRGDWWDRAAWEPEILPSIDYMTRMVKT